MKSQNKHKIHPEGVEITIEILNSVPKSLLKRFVRMVNSEPDRDMFVIWKQIIDGWFKGYVIKRGDNVRAFNSKEWSKTGDIGNNSQFWQKAIVLKTRRGLHGSPIADLKFENGTISNGHFQFTIEKI